MGGRPPPPPPPPEPMLDPGLVRACVCACVCYLPDAVSTKVLHSDGKRPDSNSIVLWKCGQIVWDATCPDTFAPSLIILILHNCCIANCSTGGEDIKKIQKYKHLDSCHFFTPVVIETTGVFGPRTIEFLKELGVEVGV